MQRLLFTLWPAAVLALRPSLVEMQTGHQQDHRLQPALVEVQARTGSPPYECEEEISLFRLQANDCNRCVSLELQFFSDEMGDEDGPPVGDVCAWNKGTNRCQMVGGLADDYETHLETRSTYPDADGVAKTTIQCNTVEPCGVATDCQACIGIDGHDCRWSDNEQEQHGVGCFDHARLEAHGRTWAGHDEGECAHAPNVVVPAPVVYTDVIVDRLPSHFEEVPVDIMAFDPRTDKPTLHHGIIVNDQGRLFGGSRPDYDMWRTDQDKRDAWDSDAAHGPGNARNDYDQSMYNIFKKLHDDEGITEIISLEQWTPIYQRNKEPISDKFTALAHQAGIKWGHTVANPYNPRETFDTFVVDYTKTSSKQLYQYARYMIHETVHNGNKVMTHCAAGVGRTGLHLMAYVAGLKIAREGAREWKDNSEKPEEWVKAKELAEFAKNYVQLHYHHDAGEFSTRGDAHPSYKALVKACHEMTKIEMTTPPFWHTDPGCTGFYAKRKGDLSSQKKAGCEHAYPDNGFTGCKYCSGSSTPCQHIGQSPYATYPCTP